MAKLSITTEEINALVDIMRGTLAQRYQHPVDRMLIFAAALMGEALDLQVSKAGRRDGATPRLALERLYEQMLADYDKNVQVRAARASAAVN